MARTTHLPAHSPRVVVVDDDPPIVEVVCAALDDAGIPALGVTQAAEAFWSIRRYQPQVVILDVQMPGVNGIDLLHQLRADPHTTDLPVIFLTANQHVVWQEAPNYAALGAVLLPKPFQLDQLLALVTQALPDSRP
jgi:CheY-like chemotaxis protein